MTSPKLTKSFKNFVKSLALRVRCNGVQRENNTTLGKHMSLGEIYAINPHELKDKELVLYIESIKKERLSSYGAPDFNPCEFAILLVIATTERAVRATTKLARKSICIASVSLIIAFVGLTVAIIVNM